MIGLWLSSPPRPDFQRHRLLRALDDVKPLNEKTDTIRYNRHHQLFRLSHPWSKASLFSARVNLRCRFLRNPRPVSAHTSSSRPGLTSSANTLNHRPLPLRCVTVTSCVRYIRYIRYVQARLVQAAVGDRNQRARALLQDPRRDVG